LRRQQSGALGPTLVRPSFLELLQGLGQQPALATYERRLAEAATALDIPLVTL
jgi:hypothetical protein